MGRVLVVLVLWCAVARAEDIPKLSLAPPSKAQVAEGKKQNVAALTLHRAKKYDAAIAGYIAALKADPSNTIARYNLASVLVSKGDTKRALEVLAQFQIPSCAYCVQRLRDAQADKEWQSLWADAKFKQIVAFAGAPAPAAAPGSGPPAPIADVQVETSTTPDRIDDGAVLAPDRVRVHVWTVIEPGFYTSPKVDIVVSGSKGEVSRTPLLPAMEMHRHIDVAIPGPGPWAVEVVRAGRVVGGDSLLAYETRCIGGKHSLTIQKRPPLSIDTSAPPFVDDPAADGASLELVHQVALTGDGAARIEWFRGGKRVEVTQAQLARDIDATCPLTFTEDRIPIPDAVRRAPGAWDVRIYERRAQAYAVAMTFAKKKLHLATLSAKAIASPAAGEFEKEAPAGAVAQGDELRAKLRGTKNTAPFTDSELPVSGAVESVPVAAVDDVKLKTPSLPAISRDGTVIAYHDEIEFSMFEGQCSPPAGGVIAFAGVGKDGVASAAQDVSTFETLQCSDGKLPGGLKAVHDDKDYMRWRIVDAKGAVVADLDGNGGNGTASPCISTKHRVAVLMVHGGVGGDCDVVGGYFPVAAKY